MSMSQEEIEALMNGIELPEEEKVEDDSVPTEEVSGSMSADDIEKLIAQTDEIETSEEDDVAVSDVDEVMDTTGDVKDNITDVLNEIDNMEEDEILLEEDVAQTEDEDMDLLLNPQEDEEDASFDEKAQNWTNKKIDKGEFPFPVEPHTRVVSQLNEVANDSEEKASKIFDVLSFILDENDLISKNKKTIDAFLDKEVELLNSLSKKFPNITLFDERLKEAQSMKEVTKVISTKLEAENMQVFEAMELMQFHDINRQKIERVMSVIRKLTVYLNNLFEEDEDQKEIAVAKYIHGDGESDLVGTDDLDALIAEFSK
ncbi:MAG: hypothetical protein ACNI3C_07180 [Candidatus Marinarcus sp.]|uniref:hypothetical protein n=1 Tax=Candidatus Marinarcus sp. TaxID=3100987 RepID=UPI003B00B89A